MADIAFEADYVAASRAQARRYALGRVGSMLSCSFFALIYLAPLFVVVANSFRELPRNNAKWTDRLPAQLFLKAWPEAWSHFCVAGTCQGIQRNFYNSLIMTIPATLISSFSAP